MDCGKKEEQPQKYPCSLLRAETVPVLKHREVHRQLVQDQARASRIHREETRPTANYMRIYMCSQGGETPKSSGTFHFCPEKWPLGLYVTA